MAHPSPRYAPVLAAAGETVMGTHRTTPIGRRETRLLPAAPAVPGSFVRQPAARPWWRLTSGTVLALTFVLMSSSTIASAILVLAQTPTLRRQNPDPRSEQAPPSSVRQQDDENLRDRYNTTVPVLVSKIERMEEDMRDQKTFSQEMSKLMVLQVERMDLIRSLMYALFGAMFAVVCGLAKQMYTTHTTAKKVDAVHGSLAPDREYPHG